LGEKHIDLNIGFLPNMTKSVYNLIVNIDELTLRDGANDMIPALENKFVAPDIFNIAREDQVVEICPLNKNIIIPNKANSISMPIMFDMSPNKPVSSLSFKASFNSIGNGLGFDK